MRPERERFCESCGGERLKRLPRSSFTILHSKSLLTAARRPLMSLSERATAARLPHSRMLAHGASLDTRNSLGNSAPMTAAGDGDEKAVAILLEAGADGDCATRAARMLAISRGPPAG